MSGQPDTTSLPTDREELLDQVLADYLRAVAAGTAPDRQQFLATYPDLATELLEFFADQDRFRHLAEPLRAAVTPARAPLPSQVGPYEILDEIARGGMGIVLRARHRTIGRVVALKLLAAGPLTNPTDVARARREAEAVAQLDHPNIVPVYDVGEHDGLPYFTMKLLDGSLAQVLRHGPLPPRIAIALLMTLARAVHHAHQRGILHRDLKPANVLLQGVREQGAPVSNETSVLTPAPSPLAPDSVMVADFGLARPTDASGLTTTGAVVGTPAYMSPEQARGDAAEVTVASDVYGLGAILYECLTGRPPFKAATPLETLRQVIDNEPDRPRSLVSGLSVDLETICLKCLHKEPGKRYASAADLAEDLRRCQNGEPIRARRAGTIARLWRMVRRQPVITGLILALVVMAVVGFALVFRQWQRAEANLLNANDQRDRAKDAMNLADEQRKQAEEARGQAEASFRQAHAAVNDFCVKFSDDLMNRPGLQALHRQLVHTARRYYQDFVKQRSNDPTLRRELADTHVRVAQITSRIGESREAVAAYREALAIYRELLDARPDDVVIQRKFVATLSNISIWQDLQDGLKTSKEALDAYRRFLAGHPDDLDLAGGLALVLSNRGAKFATAGRFPEAVASLEEAMARQEELARSYPWNDSLWSELAATFDNYGVVLSRQNQHVLALCCHLRVEEIRDRLAVAQPDNTPRRSALAAARHHVGIALQDVGQVSAARVAFENALTARREIAQSNPLVKHYQVAYALSLSNLAGWYNRQNKRSQGLTLHHQARQILQKQLDIDPTSPGLRKLVAEAWFNIGVTHGAMNQREQEGAAFANARRLQEELVRDDPADAEYRHGLGRTLNNLGINLWVRKYERESVEVLHQAVKSTSVLVKRAPRVLSYRRLLNAHHGLLAEIEWRRGNAALSIAQVRARIALWTDNPREFFNAGREFARAAALLGREPARLSANVRQRQAGWLDESMTVLRRAVKLGFADAKAFSDEDLALLRGRRDFETLVAEVEKGK